MQVPKTVSVYAILVSEIAPQNGVTPLEWMLLTSIPVTCFDEAVEKVNWYKIRWSIETYHKILKSGCNVKSCRLESADKLERYLTLFSIIAWPLHWITHINREQPDVTCTQVLAEHEWQALYCKIHKTDRPPKNPPTIRQAIRWIARLGGFLARKHDKEPGIITIWRGWQRLTDIAEDWLLFHGSKTYG